MSSAGKNIRRQHFSHDHKLTLCMKHNDWSEPRCYGCHQEVTKQQRAYSCMICKQQQVVLHETCFELPEKIINIMHPKHPLKLFHRRVAGDKATVCDHCREESWGFSYRCLSDPCNYALHIKCVTNQGFVKYEGHEHSFAFVSRPILFTCDDCGETDTDKCCICTTCQLRLHEKCVPSPTSEIPSSDDNRLVADAITNPADEIIHFSHNQHPLGITNDELVNPADEINHFSHNQHPLRISNDELLNDESCDMCNRPLLVPHYSCKDCGFFLHVKCAKMDVKLRPPLYPESMRFLETTDIERDFGTFTCHRCKQRCNGRAYYCDSTKITLDVNCASIQDTLTHDSHEHTLELYTKQSTFNCNACGFCWGKDIYSVVPKFRCEDCDFNLDLRCAMLPITCRHRSHEHPLKLNFTRIEHEGGQYYCVECEEERDPNQWFYSCKDSTQFSDAHPECLFGIKSNIKFEAPYKHSDHPGHVMSFVERSRHYYKCGSSCQRDKKDLFVFECRSCNYHFHVKYTTDENGELQLEKTEDVLLDPNL